MTISFPLPPDFFRGSRNITNGALAETLNNVANSLNPRVTHVFEKSDFGVFVGGKATLITGQHYILRAAVNLGTDVLEGLNINITGDLTFHTILTTNSPNAMITSTGTGFIQLERVLAANAGGPFLDAPLGTTPGLSVLSLSDVRFSGDPLGNGTGLGTIGCVAGADRVLISKCFFLGLLDGLKLDGTINDISIQNSDFTARAGAPSFTGVKILASAVLDIAVLDTMRFSTVNAADRCINFSPSATFGSPLRLVGSTIRGPGTFVDVTSLQKTSPNFIAIGNEGTTAPVDSQFAANASFVGNTIATVIGAGNTGVLLPIGNGAPTHELFDGGAFVERFTLSGAETQLQVFTCDARRAYTYKIEFHCQLTRSGGGTVSVGLGIQVEGSTETDSVNAVDVGNAATPGYATTTVELGPTDEVGLVVSNNSGETNVTVISGTWSISRTR